MNYGFLQVILKLVLIVTQVDWLHYAVECFVLVHFLLASTTAVLIAHKLPKGSSNGCECWRKFLASVSMLIPCSLICPRNEEKLFARLYCNSTTMVQSMHCFTFEDLDNRVVFNTMMFWLTVQLETIYRLNSLFTKGFVLLCKKVIIGFGILITKSPFTSGNASNWIFFTLISRVKFPSDYSFPSTDNKVDQSAANKM